jgi:hypothetical protein
MTRFFGSWPTASRILLQGAIFASLLTIGCSRGPVLGKTSVTYERLRLLTTAYMEANQELGRGPANVQDLEPFLKKQGDPTASLRSEQDEEFVVLWGVDHRAGQGTGSNVVAYERSARNERRYVGFVSYVVELSEDQFRALVFPNNHQP